jgi:hypothetical protein
MNTLLIYIPPIHYTFPFIYEHSRDTAEALKDFADIFCNLYGCSTQHKRIICKMELLIGSRPFINLMPGNFPAFFSEVIFLLNESPIKMYRKGERGHPFLNPLEA